MGASNFPGLSLAKPEPRWKAKAKQAADNTRLLKLCLRCGVEFSRGKPSATSRALFCSSACQYTYRREQNPKRQTPCVMCGKTIGGERRYHPQQKTCSAACGYIFRKRSLRPETTCAVCGKAYFAQLNSRVKYCSRRCYLKVVNERPAIVQVACTSCGATVRRTAAAVKRVAHVFCSRTCRAQFFVGERNPSFRGDKDPNRGAGWNRLAAQIRRRDGYSCKRCGVCETATGQKLSVDHIRPWRSFTDKAQANDPDNLAALCRKCHAFKTTTVEQAWLRGDVIAWKQWVASLSLPSAARFGMMA